MLQLVKFWLSNNFSMKDMEELAYILEIQIYRDGYKKSLDSCQSIYIDKI